MIKKFKNFLNQLLAEPTDTLRVVARIIFVLSTLTGIFYGALFIFRGVIVEVGYNPISGMVEYARQRSIFGGILTILCGFIFGWLGAVLVESYCDMIDDVHHLRNVFTEEVHDDAKVVEYILPLMEQSSERNNTIKYYESIPSVGPKTAERLFDEFSDDLGKTVREHPELLDRVRGLTDKNKQELTKFFKDK